MKRLIALFSASLALSQPVWAEGTPVVVELFTSQGCSSCPPADALMHDLAGRDDVIALALHVDYWDYIGWKDQFGDPAHAQRQRAYAGVAGRRMIYTPQMIVNGREDLVGVKAMELAELIMRYKSAAPVVALTAGREGGDVRVQLAPVAGAAQGPFDVFLVRYDPLRPAHITRGENAGRDIDYVNVVTSWTTLGKWDGRNAAELHGALKGDAPAVVLVQAAGPGAIVAAAMAD